MDKRKKSRSFEFRLVSYDTVRLEYQTISKVKSGVKVYSQQNKVCSTQYFPPFLLLYLVYNAIKFQHTGTCLKPLPTSEFLTPSSYGPGLHPFPSSSHNQLYRGYKHFCLPPVIHGCIYSYLTYEKDIPVSVLLLTHFIHLYTIPSIW